MLKLIHDSRSGSKLEIIVPTFNEERRINNILGYYGKDFDVVLLDYGSTDDTVAMAIQAGASVYRRLGETIGDNHYTHYVNEVTKSGLCFYMFADEFIKKSDLHACFAELKAPPCVVLGRRIDWAYGRRTNVPSTSTPRGLCKGTAIYNPDRLHASLEFQKNPHPRTLEFDVHHLQVWSMKTYFGQSGTYAYVQVEQFYRQGHALLRFFKRFVVSELLMLPYKLWLERKKGIAYLLWMSAMGWAVFFMGVLTWVEQRFLKRPEEQLKIYSRFYADE